MAKTEALLSTSTVKVLSPLTNNCILTEDSLNNEIVILKDLGRKGWQPWCGPEVLEVGQGAAKVSGVAEPAEANFASVTDHAST